MRTLRVAKGVAKVIITRGFDQDVEERLEVVKHE